MSKTPAQTSAIPQGWSTTFVKERFLELVMDSEPTAKSPYSLYGNPPMWPMATDGDTTLFVRPALTQERVGHQWVEVQGVAWQLRRNDTKAWIGQGYSGSFDVFTGELKKYPGHVFSWLQPAQNNASLGETESAPAPRG